MISFSPIQLAELGAVYVLLIKSGFFIANSMDFRYFFRDSNRRQAFCLIHYTMDHDRKQSGIAKMFRYIIWLLVSVDRIDWSKHLAADD